MSNKLIIWYTYYMYIECYVLIIVRLYLYIFVHSIVTDLCITIFVLGPHSWILDSRIHILFQRQRLHLSIIKKRIITFNNVITS